MVTALNNRTSDDEEEQLPERLETPDTGGLTTRLLRSSEVPGVEELQSILPYYVVKLLVRNGYRSREQVAHTPDHELLYGRRIGTGVLGVVRASIPFEPLPGTAPLGTIYPNTNLKDRVRDLEARVAALEEALRRLTEQ